MEDLQLGIVGRGGPRSAVRAVESVLVLTREKCSLSRLPASAARPFFKSFPCSLIRDVGALKAWIHAKEQLPLSLSVNALGLVIKLLFAF